MELTRRDALAAAAGAAGVATVGELSERLDERREFDDNEHVLSRLLAVSRVVYPSEVEATTEFLHTYVLGREYDREGYVEVTARALDGLDRRSRRLYGSAFATLSVERRDECLREIGVSRATPDPDGTTVERIRYYVVNQLLYALYTSPTGGRLVGNENPPGYPGGRQAYQEGPDDV